MPLGQVIGLLLVLVVVYALIEWYAPANRIKEITKAVLVIFTVLFLLDLFFDIRGALNHVFVGRR